MEKFGVYQGSDDSAMIKAAASGCPQCGSKPQVRGNILVCPLCGSAPFEQKDEDGREEDSSTR